MFQATVKEISDPAVLTAAAPLIDKAEHKGTVAGTALAGYAIPNYGSNNLITLRYRLKEWRMQAAETEFMSGKDKFPAGTLVLTAGGDEAMRKLRGVIEPLGLNAVALPVLPTVAMHDVDLPRLAMFTTWGNTQEVGWVRHALDQFEVRYDLIYKERIKQGNLRDAYDVILIPNQGRSGKGLVFDIEPKSKPLAYTKTDQFKTMGTYGESEDITGGMGLAGAAELQKFTEAGGVLITLGAASFFPPEFGLTRSIDAGRTSAQFYAPGPIIEAEILQPNHPLFYGYTQKTIPVRYGNGPLLNVPERDRAQQILMRYPGGDKSVLSGLMRGANEVSNRPAIVDVPVGKGRVLLFADNPCYRWQNHGEFGLLFNAVLHYNDLGGAKK